MNCVRSIATAGIVAGSVTLAGALLTSGGVGASFVDAAEVGASISVVGHFEDIEPLSLLATGCVVAIDPVSDGLAFITDTAAADPTSFDLAALDRDQTRSATISFTISAPNAPSFASTWSVQTAGDLQVSSSGDAASATGSATFTWPASTEDQAAQGTGTITVTCTPQPPTPSDPESGSDVGTPSTDGDGGTTSGPSTAPITYIYTLAVGIDIPAAEPVETKNSDGSTSDSDPVLCDPDGEPVAGSPDCSAPVQQTEPDCTPGGADAVDPEKCPPTDPLPAGTPLRPES
mgnify:CR=1 FL=1